MVKLDDINLGGYLRINQGENRDIEFEVFPNKFVLEDFKRTFFEFLTKSINNELNTKGFKFKLLDENNNVVVETDTSKLDFYETEDSYISEVKVSYQDSDDPTEDRHIYKILIEYITEETTTDENGNTTTQEVEHTLFVSNAPQRTIFAEELGDNKKGVIIHKDDGKATIEGKFKFSILK
jgi:hypothetical protein